MMTVEDLMTKIKSLIPELGADQSSQIAAILRLAFGEPASSPPEDALSGSLTEEIRAAFDLITPIDARKMAANLDDVIVTIEEVVSLSDDLREKLAAILQLALASADEGEPMEDYEEDEPMPDEELFEDEEEEALEFDEEEMRTIVGDAVRSVLSQQETPARRTRARTRPPFVFKPTGEEADMSPLTALNEIRFGQMSKPMRTIATDLYGMGYDDSRHNQRAAFGLFLRHGKAALDGKQIKSLKRVILTPIQIKSLVESGASIRAIKTDMAEVIDELGGFLVPEDFRTNMIERLPGMTVIRPMAEVYPTGSDMMVRVKVTGGDARYTSAVRVTWVGDVPAAASADTNPTFGLERTPIHICKATVHVPMALLEDTPFPLVNKINEWVAEAYAIDEDEQFLIGNGKAKPEGILPDQLNGNSLAEENSGSNTTILFDAIYDVQYAIAQQYWVKACWIMNRSTAKIVRKLKDGDGNYLWETSNQAGQPDNLVGYPVKMSEAMPDIAQNAFPVLYGDVGGTYQIADRVGMSVIRDDVTKAEEDMVKFVFRRRLGGQLKAEWAMAAMKIST